MICQAASLTGRLNAFQRVMLQWGELHPYNAVHTYQIAGPLDFQAFRLAVQNAFDFNGIGAAEVDVAGGWYRHELDEEGSVEVRFIGGEGSPEELLTSNIASEMNRPFERPRCRPFRFSVVDGGPDSHFVSLTYDHWAADSIGARLVMRHVLGRYLDLDIPENENRLDLYPGTYREVFSHRLQGRRLAWPMWRSIRSWLGNRKTWRVAYGTTSQMSMGFAMHKFRHDAVRQIRQFAKDHEASVNDVFLAALCRAMLPQLPKRFAKMSGTGMTLGTIVDTRSDACEDLSESMGMFLGYYLVRVSGDKHIGLGELARQVAVMTREKKQQRSYLDSAVNFRVSGAIWPRLKPENKPFFALRALPMSAGISNVNLRDTWIDQQGAGKILDFRRAAPTGPSLPLAISPTTVNGRLNVGFSYRETGFSQSKIENVMQSFAEQLETLEKHAKTSKAGKKSGRTTCAA